MLSQYRGEGKTNLTLTKNYDDLDKTDSEAKRQLKDDLSQKRHKRIINNCISQVGKSVSKLDVVTMAVCEGGHCCGMCHCSIVYCYSVTPDLDTGTRAANQPSRSCTVHEEGRYQGLVESVY